MKYWLVDAFFFMLSFIYAILSIILSDCSGLICSVTIIWIYPLFLEQALNSISKLQSQPPINISPSSRFVYHPGYNVSLWGLQKSHPFDGQRYRKVYNLIVERGLLEIKQQVRPSQIISRKFLMQKMNLNYLRTLCYGFQVAKLLELKEWWLPGWFLRWRVLDPMLLASQGSLVTANLALKLGWAVNLSGGFHHASYTQGGGFCIYPDISLTVHYLQSQLKTCKIMIIDLDAHQGNGFERDLILNQDVYIVDCYNRQIFKDTESEDSISRRLHVHSKTTNKDYLRLIDSICEDFNYFKPEFVIYNAGSDILEEDPLGEMSINEETVVERDEKVVGMCRGAGVPVMMLLSGGYQHINAEVIANSLANLIKKWG